MVVDCNAYCDCSLFLVRYKIMKPYDLTKLSVERLADISQRRPDLRRAIEQEMTERKESNYYYDTYHRDLREAYEI